jgi:hypothetical protein
LLSRTVRVENTRDSVDAHGTAQLSKLRPTNYWMTRQWRRQLRCAAVHVDLEATVFGFGRSLGGKLLSH